jgi:hypothetical protein
MNEIHTLPLVEMYLLNMIFWRGVSVINNHPRDVKVWTICERMESTFFYMVGFINDDVFDGELLENRFLNETHLVCCYAYFEVLGN